MASQSSAVAPVTVADLCQGVLRHHPACDTQLIEQAYRLAREAHQGQERDSGEPYIHHPLRVARLMAEMRLDDLTIATALLHDVLEDTPVTGEHITSELNARVTRLVDGVTKLSRLEQRDHAKSQAENQAENFRKLVIAMSKDIRVMLVKLGDRLDNMRTINGIKSVGRRQRIATETMDIYAPLADRMGLSTVKEELQDRAFAVLHPDARRSILRRLRHLRRGGEAAITQTIERLHALLRKAGLNADVVGREKSPYSIWMKMQNKQIEMEKLFDLTAFRITVETVGDCYAALGVLHEHYHFVSDRFKDYISTPKENGYQSLHTGLLDENGGRLEIQIRTATMHEVAERGVAAHWQYKANEDVEGGRYRWLRELVEILEGAYQVEEGLEDSIGQLNTQQVFCFTPAGRLLSFPRGATPVDFAYAVHSHIGHNCQGARVNGSWVPLRYQLHNGDQVEIIVGRKAHPNPEWERFVVTAKAKAGIRRFIRAKKRDEFIRLGREMLRAYWHRENKTFVEKKLASYAAKFNVKEPIDVCEAVGGGTLSPAQVFHALYPPKVEKTSAAPKPVEGAPVLSEKEKAVAIRGLIPGLAVHYAGCCHPVPGDAIVGIVSSGRGVTIHTQDCHMLENFRDEPERRLDVSWDHHTGQLFSGRIRVLMDNSPGVLSKVTESVAKHGGNIVNLRFETRYSDVFHALIDVSVTDARHLGHIVAGLQSSRVVIHVERVR
ncbi:MAG: bifunctional (p)ppGpp synthetase/guanosine-3',5'-bis(diphosphate) 3'-pyrophosphohydrolase [Pseudomonadota bacterium]